jgi:hypothetical protein
VKKWISFFIAISLLLLPVVAYGQEQTASQPPPVEQPLVREGEFAMKLMEALQMGKAESETEAESSLASVGIAPRNGWISDYPVTADIIGELEKSVLEAAEANRISLGSEEALDAFQVVVNELALPVMADTREPYTTSEPPRGYSDSAESSAISNYYYSYGPPVVTYYPPPWNYYYLYSWVPYPFWYNGFFFHGFFALHDFHRVIVVKKKHVCVTNHVKDPHTKKVWKVDPVARRNGHNNPRAIDRPRQGGFHSTDARKGAEAILERSRQRATPANNPATRSERTSTERQTVRPESFNRPERQRSERQGAHPKEGKSVETRGRSAPKEPTMDRGRVRDPVETRSFQRPNVDRSTRTNVQRPSINESRSFGSSSRGGGGSSRSFSGPSTGGREFSTRGGSGFRGSFGGGGSRGGCVGRC